MSLTIHTGIKRGVYFNDMHSFDDFNLILQSETIPPATPKTAYEDIDGMDGAKDLTAAIGEVKFKNRTGKLTFFVDATDDFEAKKRQVSNYLNGQVFKITIEKDADYYWYGRCYVSEYKSNGMNRQIVVDVNVQPYKLKQAVTSKQFELTAAAATITLPNDRKAVCPLVVATGTATIVFGENTYNIAAAGTYKWLTLRLLEGNNALMVSGSGNITFSYQEGSL